MHIKFYKHFNIQFKFARSGKQTATLSSATHRTSVAGQLANRGLSKFLQSLGY